MPLKKNWVAEETSEVAKDAALKTPHKHMIATTMKTRVEMWIGTFAIFQMLDYMLTRR